MTCRRTPICRRAFTLIEIIVVVVVLGLLATLARWGFSGPLRRAQLDEVLEQIRYLDASSRELARQTGRPMTIAFDIDRDEVFRREGRRGGAVIDRAAISTGATIERVRTVPEDRAGGAAEVVISPLGLSPSYAVLVAGPEWRRWVFVSGLGGQARVVSDDSEIAAMFEAAREAGRGHAD